MYNGDIRKEVSIHRLVALYFIPNPENKPWVNHIDGNTYNNDVSNLEWCTPTENEVHSIKVLGRDRNSRLQRQAASIQGKSKRSLTMKQATDIRFKANFQSRMSLACESMRRVLEIRP